MEAIHLLNTNFQIHAFLKGFCHHAGLLLKQALISKVGCKHQECLPKEQARDYFQLIVLMLYGISIAHVICTVPTSILLQVGTCLRVGIAYVLSIFSCFPALLSLTWNLFELWKTGGRELDREETLYYMSVF